MMQVLSRQYELIKSSREVVLDYCSAIKPEDFTKKVNSFNNSSISDMLLHIANTYLFWLKRFASGQEFEYFNSENTPDIDKLRNAFNDVNYTAEEFMLKHNDSNELIDGEIFWLKKNMSFTVLQLLTHVMTHEFHHKGQVMTMSRMLGYTPPDADIIRF